MIPECHRLSRVFIALVVVALTQPQSARAIDQPVIHYDIKVTLDVPAKTLTGRETIRYTSGADTALSELYLHAYPNALSGRGSTLAREMESIYHDYSLDHARADELSSLDINSLAVDGAAGRYEIDDTSVRVILARPLAPHDSLLLAIEFVTKVPELPGRFRTQNSDFSIAQWYPKMAVYDRKGWHHDTYHLTGEFYGDFATYDVSITLPTSYFIGATGEYVSGDGGDNNMPALSAGKLEAEAHKREIMAQVEDHRLPATKTLRFHAEHVHDFAWVTSPNYVIDETDWNGVKVKAVVFAHEAETKWSNLLSYEIAALEFFVARVGEFPYPTLTVAEAYNFPTGGMEYPALVMMDPGANVPFTHALEYVTVHEVGHNWFYGALANNELDDPWLDEGFAEYFTLCYADQAHKDGNIFDLPPWASGSLDLPYRWTHEIEYQLLSPSSRSLPIAQSAYLYADELEYRAIAYSKGALFLQRLNVLVGDSVFNQTMRTYYSEYKFKHVTISDFSHVATRVSGQALREFSEPLLRSSDTIPGTIQLDTVQNPEVRDVKFVRPLAPFAFFDPDHYVIGINPLVWYNKVDKTQIGLYLSGGYLMTQNSFSARFYYGTESRKTCWRAGYSTPLLNEPYARIALRAARNEGTRDYSVELGNSRPGNLLFSVIEAGSSQFPSFRADLSFLYSDRYDADYLDSRYFDLGKTAVVNLQGSYMQREYEGITRLDYSLAQGVEAFGSTSSFRRGNLSLGQDLRLVRTGELVMNLRGHAGCMSKEAPKQEQLALGYGIPWSTVDPIYQYVADGGGGVRGYQNDAPLGNQLFAANLELSSERHSLDLPGIDLRLFFDAGRVNNPVTSRYVNKTLYDAGMEFRVLNVLQLSVPLWLSEPPEGHNQIGLRVVARVVFPEY